MFTKIIGVLTIDGEEQFNGWLEIGAFDENDICRGAKNPVYRSKTGQWIYSLQIRAVDGATIHFKVYDHENNCELDLVDDLGEVITYQGNYTYQWNGANSGTSNPYHINFTHAGGTTLTLVVQGYGAENVESNLGYYLIASPIENVNPEDVEGMTDAVYDLYAFSDAVNGEEWINYDADPDPHPFTTLAPGTGYLYALQETDTLTFTGTLTTTTEVTLQKTDGANFSGWNLVGNPFNGPAYIAKQFYRMNDERNDLVASASDDFINPLEGVFVLAENDGETLEFSNTSSKGALVALNVTKDNTLVDRAVVCFDKDRNLPKFQLNPNHTKVYIPVDNSDFAVVSADAQGELPVNFKAEKNGSYTIGFNTDNVAFGYLHLIDNLTGNDVDLLASPNYSFDATTSDYASRFRLVFATSDFTDDHFAFISNGEIVLNGVDGNTNVQLFDVTGRMLRSAIGVNTIATENLSAGVYMVQLVNGSNVKSQKIVVK